ncbi:MAG: dephospho-CoA kinase [Paracoccaceae bacterium]
MTQWLGLTGSIGMGKSTTAQMFADLGAAVWDADAAVHRLYDVGGLAVAPMQAAFPDAIENGAVSRPVLKRILMADPDALSRIEAIVHPLVRADRADFAAQATAQVVVFDIPLLFETGSDTEMDATACVSVDPGTQRARVLARGTLTEAQFQAIVAKQMPNDDKCARATYVIPTRSLAEARAAVAEIMQTLTDSAHA